MDQLQNLQGWMTTNSDGLETCLLYVVAALLFPFAYGVIFDKAVIRSGFLLIAVFGGISSLFMLLQAQFLAMAQVMIYAVGITLVVVIALMLTNPKLEREETTAIPTNQYLGFITALFMFMTIYMSLFGESFPVTTEISSKSNLQLIGTALTTTYALPFEFASILLLAAVVGSVMLAKSDKNLPDDDEYEEEVENEAETFAIKKDGQGNEPASVAR
jgi:NADH:ubiquinone oxidoreductase subunit 6 (subunit J)